ncbi:hypothetical protein [Lactiplantibacillus plantarum]|uniref:hypothetical protein n=2 Tax=Lactobacillaceae TaxID=33958 RepID=UPI00217D7E15|nr:hypothetical protein [Lactiplantibacillus plantarum]
MKNMSLLPDKCPFCGSSELSNVRSPEAKGAFFIPTTSDYLEDSDLSEPYQVSVEHPSKKGIALQLVVCANCKMAWMSFAGLDSMSNS